MTVSHIRYGIALGALVGALCFVADAVVVSIWGARIPLLLPVIMAGAYVACGCCIGALFGVVVAVSRGGLAGAGTESRPSGESDQGSTGDRCRPDWEPAGADLIRRAFLFGCLAGIGMNFVERARLGYVAYMDNETGYMPVAAGLIAAVLSIVLLGRGKSSGRLSTGVVWQIAGAAIFCSLWQPFSTMYDAPFLSRTSVLANLGYLAVASLVFVAFGKLGRPLIVTRVERLRPFSVGATQAVVAGLVVSVSIMLLRAGQPIDLPFKASEQRVRLRGSRLASSGAEIPRVRLVDLANSGAGGSTDERAIGTSRNVSRNSKNTVPPYSLTQRIVGPDVILLVLDTVRADHMSVYGYEIDTTPNLRRFASEGVMYEQAIAPSSWTLPSHASMFTGLLPTEHGAHNIRVAGQWNIHPLADRFETLAEQLTGFGYYCAGIVANTACLSREFGVHQGFHFYDDRSGGSLAAAKPGTISPALWICHLLQRFVEPWRKDWSRSAEEINRDVIRWLDRGSSRPRFLFVNYLDAHAPYHTHPETELERRPQVGVAGGAQLSSEMSESAWRYDQEIAYLDGQVGALFEALRARGIYDDALIIVTSDHGEAFGEHDNVGHGQTLYQEEIRVPLLVKYPGSSSVGVRRNPICLTALPGLILNYLGFGLSAFPDGTDPATDDTIMSELRDPAGRGDQIGGPDVIRAVFSDEGYKVIARKSESSELFNLSDDPFELRNLAVELTEPVQRVLKYVDDWAGAIESRNGGSEHVSAMSERLRDRLRSLGYLK